ncbi:MAG: chemotaxis protein CheD [Deltaproteobacteria bacterium]|nr:chemotaxis protein CheD [Deltaproteobacteria bacterium]
MFAESGPCVITTVLGSCISICLWDPVLRIGGMNHYLLPFWNGDGLQTPKYGNIAIRALMDRMLENGCRKMNLLAKVFGGANTIGSSSGILNIGERNISLAEKTLLEEKITVVSNDTGGTSGRKVMFVTESGEVFVRKMHG